MNQSKIDEVLRLHKLWLEGHKDGKRANLSEANLYGADLSGARLWDTIGNGVEIRTLQLPEYTVVYAGDRIQIGCKNHSIQEWSEFDDEVIKGMSDNALDFWKKYKTLILLDARQYGMI